MGNELGQLREWDEKREQDWEMRRYPAHDAFYHYMAELNHLYLTHPALSQWDYREGGFSWLDCHQEDRCIYAICRRSESERLVALFNFSDHRQENYTVKVPGAKKAQVLLHSDWERFGGATPEGEPFCRLAGEELICSLPPFSAVLLKVKTD